MSDSDRHWSITEEREQPCSATLAAAHAVTSSSSWLATTTNDTAAKVASSQRTYRRSCGSPRRYDDE